MEKHEEDQGAVGGRGVVGVKRDKVKENCVTKLLSILIFLIINYFHIVSFPFHLFPFFLSVLLYKNIINTLSLMLLLLLLFWLLS